MKPAFVTAFVTAYVVELVDRSAVARSMIQPTQRKRRGRIFLTRTGNWYQYDTIKQADVFGTRAYAQELCESHERVIKVRVAITLQ